MLWLSDEELEVATEAERIAYGQYLRQQLYVVDPVHWGSEVLREQWWSVQRQIIEAVRDHRRVAVRSCHGAGKSFIAARVVAWWLSTHTAGRAAAVSTAPTGHQVKAILWKEINQAHKKGQLPGRTNLTEWYIDGQLVGMGRKVNDYEPTSFQGIHAPEGVLVVYDEACGVSEELFRAGASMASNESSRQLAIGNPDVSDSYFAKLFEPESGWYPIHIDGLLTPNFTDEDVIKEVAGSLIDASFVEDIIRDYGEDSPVYRSKVRGEFSEDSSDGVVPFSKLSACRYLQPNMVGPIDLGLDVGASVDGDATIIRERRGNYAGKEWELHTDDAEEIVGTAVRAINETGATRIKVDVIGVGFGIAGHLKALRSEGAHGAKVIGVNVGERASQPHRFPNLRSEIWWEVARRHCLEGTWSLADLDEKTQKDLIAPRYRTDARGLTVVEPKEETRKRLKRSPDHADALNLAFYEPHGHGQGKTFGRQIASARVTS